MKVLLAAQALPEIEASQVQLALLTGWHSANADSVYLSWNLQWQTDLWGCLASSLRLGMSGVSEQTVLGESDLNIPQASQTYTLTTGLAEQVIMLGTTSAGANKWWHYSHSEFSLQKLYTDSANYEAVTVFWGTLSNIDIFAQMQQLIAQYGWQAVARWAKQIQIVCLIDNAFIGVQGIIGHTRFGQTKIADSAEIRAQNEEKNRCAALAEFVHIAKQAGVYQFSPAKQPSTLSVETNLLTIATPFDSTSCGKQKGSGAGGGLAAILSAVGAKLTLVSDYLYNLTNLETGKLASCDLVCAVVDELILPMDPLFELLGTRCLELGVPVVVMARKLLAGKHELPQLGVVETWPLLANRFGQRATSQMTIEQNHIISRAKRIAHMWSQ